MIDGKIYKILCNTTGKIYIGSTTQTLEQRLCQHKCKNTTAQIILKNNNYEIILIENYSCNSRKELQLRESFYIKNNECVNSRIPVRTEKLSEINKQYYENNKEQITEQHKQYYENNKEKYKKKYQYQLSWGGNKQTNNNLLKIDTNLFE